MHEIISFAAIVLVVAGGLTLALAWSKLSERIPVPAAALFLILGAVLSDIFPALERHASIRTVERVVVVAVVVILFDGGMHIGWRRFRAAILPITTLGFLGTFGTAAVVAGCCHLLLDLSWITSGLIGAALAPTDPAVMFSVLGGHEVGGRTDTILEGESGANDPVGIALMLAMIQFATSSHGSFLIVVREFAVATSVGLAIGIVAGRLLVPLMRIRLPSAGLYPVRTVAACGVVYGLASVAHGSGFLAVFVAGILVGDERAPFKAEIEAFHSSLASLAEVAAFGGLGLTIDLSFVGHDWLWLKGLLIAALLVFLARPLVAGLLLLPVRLERGERLFLFWGGLKGAVPILLAAFAVLADVNDAKVIYSLVFVAVAFSVLVQGTTVPFAAGRLGIPISLVEQTPWRILVPLRSAPESILRVVVAESSAAAGMRIRDLELSDTWIGLIVREGEPLQARGTTKLRPGDELLIVSSPDSMSHFEWLFAATRE
ncbi:MAG: cation:proton antiporter [Gaiellaceae bacterium]